MDSAKSEKYVEELITRISPELELDCHEKDGCSICRDGKAALRAAIKEAMSYAYRDAAEWADDAATVNKAIQYRLGCKQVGMTLRQRATELNGKVDPNERG